MSYDVSMVIRQDDMEAEMMDCGNYTYNVSRMFTKAGLNGLDGINGLKGRDAAPLLDIAIASMESRPDEYKLMNPPNGWGNYEGALQFLRKIYQGCRDYPNAYVSVT